MLLRSECNRDHSKMKNESVKKSLEKTKNVLDEKHKNGQAKNLHNKLTKTFTIISLFREQLNKTLRTSSNRKSIKIIPLLLGKNTLFAETITEGKRKYLASISREALIIFCLP